MVRKKLERKQ